MTTEYSARSFTSPLRANQEDLDEKDALRNKLEEASGFRSYDQYLETYENDYPVLKQMRVERWNFTSNEDEKQPFAFTVIDVSRASTASDSSIAVRFRDFSVSPVDLLEDLCNPPDTSICRVLLCWIKSDIPAPRYLLDVCGLCLQIGPQFFDILAEKSDWKHRYPKRRGVFRSYQNLQVIVGRQIATVSYDYIKTRARVPPVLVIVGWDEDRWTKASMFSCQPRDLCGVPPFEVSGDSNRSNVSAKTRSESVFYGSRAYLLTLQHMLQERLHDLTMKDADILSFLMLPLPYLDLHSLQGQSRSIRRLSMIGYSSDDLLRKERRGDTTSFELRRHIRDSEVSQREFPRFVRSCGGTQWLEHRKYIIVLNVWQDALLDAKAIVAEARDLAQRDVSRLALQDSQKSIELSNHQIQENQRCERLFVFQKPSLTDEPSENLYVSQSLQPESYCGRRIL